MFEKTIKDTIIFSLLNKTKVDLINDKILSKDLDPNKLIDLTIKEAQILYFPFGLLVGILISIIAIILWRYI